MVAQDTFGIAFWGFLAFYGLALYAVAPSARTVEGFFRGRDGRGRPTSRWMLTSSIFIAWIFAKSVTNAANLGAAYGVVGGLFLHPGFFFFFLFSPPPSLFFV